MITLELNDPSFLPHLSCRVRLDLGPGEALVLVGENGIGKTTLLSRLSAVIEGPRRVLIEQKAATYFFDRKVKTLKTIFLTENLPGMNLERFDFLWSAFGLQEKEDRLLSQLSGGEGQALKLALALCRESAIYFLDEPSQFLDLGRKRILADYLSGLVRLGSSLVIVEHNRDWLPREFKFQELLVSEGVLVKREAWTIS